MKKYSVLIILVILFFCASNIMAGDDDEKTVFKSLKCGICHKVDTGKAYPSLREIATVYNGDREKLISYLQGKSAAIVNEEKSKTMEKYLEKTKALSDDELKSLAEYMMCQND